MARFGWTRLAYLLLVLTVLMVLTRPGSPGAETRSLTTESPQDTKSTGAGPSDVVEPPETTQMTRRIEGAISSLVDLGGVSPTTPPPGPAARSPGGPEAVPSEAPATTPTVFYRPPAADRSSGGTPADGSGPVCGDLGRFPVSRRVVFPLEERYFYSYEDTWGAPRTQGGHEGTDLMAPAGAPEYAVTDGTVVPVAGSNENGWNTLGGYAVMVRADYSIGPVKAGDLFYYAHLGRLSALKVGTRVRAGQVIGYSGDTGQGPEVTRGLFPAHLHLGWYDTTGDRSEADSGAMNPYPLLEWIKANGGAVTGGSSARYCEALGPRVPVPSTGERDWPAPDTPGLSPDLDPGANDPNPSLVVRNEAPAQTAPIRRIGPATRAIPERATPERATPKRTGRTLQDHTARRGSRDASAKDMERSGSPEPPLPETLKREVPAANPPRPEPPKPGPPRPEPPGREAPKPPSSSSGAPPAQEPSTLGPGGEEAPDVSWVRPTLQGSPLKDLLEGLMPDPDPALADTDKRDRPDNDPRDEKNEKGQAEHRVEQDREEQPATNEPETPSNPPAEPSPPKDEPSLSDLQSDEPDQETTEPETTEQEADEQEEDEPETTEPEMTEPEITEPPETTTG